MTTLLGITAGTFLLFYAIFTQGGIEVFISAPALMITCGGTLASTFISFPLPRVFRVFTILKNIFRKELGDPSAQIALLVRLASKARKESILSLQSELQRLGNRFLRVGIELVVDGHHPQMVRDVLETELDSLITRHEEGAYIFRIMARFAPAFGLIGTLIGLIAMLRGIGGLGGGLQSLGPAMAVALVTTFYGALMANLLFLPIAEKLTSRSETEVLQIRIIIEGVLLIQEGVNPLILQQKLNAFLSPELRAQHYERLIRSQKVAPSGTLAT